MRGQHSLSASETGNVKRSVDTDAYPERVEWTRVSQRSVGTESWYVERLHEQTVSKTAKTLHLSRSYDLPKDPSLWVRFHRIPAMQQFGRQGTFLTEVRFSSKIGVRHAQSYVDGTAYLPDFYNLTALARLCDAAVVIDRSWSRDRDVHSTFGNFTTTCKIEDLAEARHKESFLSRAILVRRSWLSATERSHIVVVLNLVLARRQPRDPRNAWMCRQNLSVAALEHVLARKHYDAEYQQASARARTVLRTCSAIRSWTRL